MIFKAFDVEFNFSSPQNLNIQSFDYFVQNFSKEGWERETFNVFKDCANLEKCVIDIGAWIGPTSIWLSKNFKHVFAIEADPIALLALRDNLKNSGCNNVTIIDSPISAKSEKVYFGRNSFNGNSLGSSTSQMKMEKKFEDDTELNSITLSQILDMVDPSEISLIKVDIEGGEELIMEDLFKTCAKHKIDLYLAFHTKWWQDKNFSRFESLYAMCNNHSIEEINRILRANSLVDIRFKF